MIKADLLISKKKLKYKLKDRKRIKGYSFTFSPKKEFDSKNAEMFRKKRKLKYALNKKDVDTLKNNLDKIRKDIASIEKSQKERKLLDLLNNNNKINNTFSDYVNNILNKFKRKEKKNEKEFNIKNNKMILKNKICVNDYKNIINNMKIKYTNFYEIVKQSHIKENIKKNKNINDIKFFTNFFTFINKVKRTYSSKSFSKKYITRNSEETSKSNHKNTNNFNLYYSSIFKGKQKNHIINLKKNNKSIKKDEIIFDKSFTPIHHNTISWKTLKHMNLNKQSDFQTKKLSHYQTEHSIQSKNENTSQSFNMNIIKRSHNKAITSYKNKIKLRKKNKTNYVINKPLYTSHIKDFLINFKKIRENTKKITLRRKQAHLTTFSNIENNSEIGEDMHMLLLKLKYINTKFPQTITHKFDKRKLFLNKLKLYFDKLEQRN